MLIVKKALCGSTGQPILRKMKHMWFYKQTTVGPTSHYHLHHFRVLTLLFALFGMIGMAFVAHAIRWESGAIAILSVAAALAGFSGHRFFGETMAIKQKMSDFRQ